MTISNIEKKSIIFQNNNEAVAVSPAANTKAEDILAALAIRPCKAVILILGGASDLDEKLIPRLTQLFGRGLARAAAEAEAMIIDGGTQAGVVAIMGEAVASRGHKSILVGVAPAGKVTYPGAASSGTPLEPNHSHFVLVEGNDWGSETATLYSLASVLIRKGTAAANSTRKTRKQDPPNDVSRVPGLAILVGGRESSKNEVLRAVRQSLPLVIVEGSGGLADQLATAWKQRDAAADDPDPVIAEIVADGELHLHLLSNPIKAFERLIIREFGIDKVLMQAWEVFSDYDFNANLQQKRFSRLQFAIIVLGVAGTAIAISQQIFGPRENGNLLLVPFPEYQGRFPPSYEVVKQFFWWALHHVLILVPILLTILITAANRFKQGNKWLLLRAGAESIKREIYRYRSRALDYKENPEQQLAQKVEDITRRTMRTEVNSTSLLPYDKDQGFPPHMFATKGGDDGFSYLTPDRYVEVRLGDQLSYYQSKAVTLEGQLKVLYWMTFIIGGLGAYLAAVNQQAWIALTTAIVAAIGTYLGYRQSENTLTKYNQAATDLANVKAWWNGLSADQQSLAANIDSLVQHTEQVLQSELDGWVQQMQDALAELRKGSETAAEKEEKREPREPVPPPDDKNGGEENKSDPNKTPDQPE